MNSVVEQQTTLLAPVGTMGGPAPLFVSNARPADIAVTPSISASLLQR
jgi:hypothetical protein